MFPTGPDPRRAVPPAFSLDRKDMMRAKQRRQLSRTEWRMVIFLPLLLGLLAWTMWDWKDRIAAAMAGQQEVLPITARLEPMARPGWEALPELPTAAAIAAERESAESLVAANAGVPLTAIGLDPITLAWAEARLEVDRKTPPMPQRLQARDLLLSDHVRLGTPLIIEGRLEDRLPGRSEGSERAWQRLLVAIDEGQYVEVLSDARAAAEVPMGMQVRVTGRLLAYDQRQAGAAKVEMPVILGRVVVESAAPKDERDALAEFHRPFSMPSELFGEVDDFRLWTETRPYYYLLGQVLRDLTTAGAWDGAKDGNQAADDMHMRPAEFRGQPFQVTGYVYEAWEDHEVARDQPFGVARVLRLLAYRRDIAPVTESLNGVEKRAVKQVLRLYEFACVTEQPAPPKGTLITVQGRFLKKRAIPVKADEMRDRANSVQRQSDRVYTWMFVTGPWKELEQVPTYEIGALGWGIAIVAGILLLIGVVWWRREAKDPGSRMRDRIAAVRASRQKLEEAKAAPAAPAGTDPPPPAPSQDAPGGQAPPAP